MRERQDAGAARQTDIDGRMGTELDAGLRDSHMRCSRSFTTYSPRARGAREKRAAPPPPFMQPRVRVKSYTVSQLRSERASILMRRRMQICRCKSRISWRLWWDLPTNESMILGNMHIFSSLMPWPLSGGRVEDVRGSPTFII